MRQREYTDLHELRRDVVALMRAGRYEFSAHARNTHQEIPLEAKREAILAGGHDGPNRDAKPGKPSSVCWAEHPRFGLVRAVYAVVEGSKGPRVFIITAFQEEGRSETHR